MTALVRNLVDQMVEKIGREAMQPGDRLSERQLAQEFRVPLPRAGAAARRLTEAGVLSVGDHSGYRIAAPQPAPAALSNADRCGGGNLPDHRARPAVGRVAGWADGKQFLRRYPLTKAAELAHLLRRIAAEGWIERLPGHGWSFPPMLTSLETIMTAIGSGW